MGDVVLFEKESHNVYDAHAVRISLLDGRQLGYVPRTATSHFGGMPVVGRIKSVGTNPSGFFGAFVYVQPQLPSLLPPFFPERLSQFMDPFVDESDKELRQLMTQMKRHYVFECAVTGFVEDLIPCIFWNVHSDIKRFEAAALQFLHRELLPVMTMQSNQDTHHLDLICNSNSWTQNEGALYIQTCMDRSHDADVNTEWTVDVSKLKESFQKFRIPVPDVLSQD